ncbi:hypothetical protein [Halorussus pelagicus]|uniref:hypothetical protein n=1 Tax=Halorussus pelagicus TaxID=2505977 RepID=UPI000FFC196A|nr:hypothetical protein [Halorussus pelagicus]
MGRLFTSPEAKATREWLRNHFDPYPHGIKKIYKERRSGEIHIRLEETLDLELLKNVIKGHGLEPEITEDREGTRVLNVYNIIEEDGEVITKSLHSVFREQKDIGMGIDPVQEESVKSRLVFVCDYLRGKYQ